MAVYASTVRYHSAVVAADTAVVVGGGAVVRCSPLTHSSAAAVVHDYALVVIVDVELEVC